MKLPRRNFGKEGLFDRIFGRNALFVVAIRALSEILSEPRPAYPAKGPSIVSISAAASADLRRFRLPQSN
jgi:hypothetical protein